MKLIRKAGSTSNIFQIFVRDSSSGTGAGLTGLTNASGSLTAYYHRDTDTTATAISLVTMTVGSFTSSGFKEIDSANMPGWYQFCPPDAALASGAKSVAFHLKGATNMVPLPIEVDLDSQIDVTHWNGTAVSSPATAGIPDVNVKNINNVSASSVTTVSANQGTTQPINFTGTGASALAKSDMVDVAGAAVSTSSAQIGVNAVNIGGTSQTGRDIGASVLLSSGTGTGQLDFTSGVVKANLAQILGTALTETAGQIAAGFKQFFNIGSPTSTMNTITTVTTATNLTNAPTSGDFTTAMKTSLNNATPSVTVSDKTGFSLTSAYDPAKTAAQAGDAMALTSGERTTLAGVIWAVLTSGLTTVGSIGKLLVDNINATISSRSSHSAADVWAVGTRTLSAFSFAVDISSAAVTLIWDKATSALTTAGSVGKLLVDNINATISSRSSHSASDVWAVGTRTLTGFGTLVSDIWAAVTDSAGVTTLLSRLTSGRASNLDNLDAAISTRSTYAGGDTSGTTTLLSRLSSGRASNLDNLDAAISSRLASGSYTAPPSVSDISDGVWDETLSDHLTSGSTGEALNGASSAGDPWATALPGSYGAGSAGSIVGNNLDAAVSSRSSHSAPDVWAVGTRTLSAFSFAVDISAAAVTAIWDKATSALSTAGSIGKRLVDNIDAAISSRSTYAGGDTAGTTTLLGRLTSTRAGNLDNLDVAVSTRLASGSYTTPPTVTQIRTELDTNSAKLANLDVAVSTRSTFAGGAVASVTAPVTVGTNNDKSGYSLSVTPPTAAQIRSEIDSNSTKLDVAVSTRLAAGSYTAPPTAAQNAAGLLDLVDGVEADYTVRGTLRIMLAAMAGLLSGANTTEVTIRDVNDTTDRIVATVDTNGNRTAVVLDAS